MSGLEIRELGPTVRFGIFRLATSCLESAVVDRQDGNVLSFLQPIQSLITSPALMPGLREDRFV